MRVSFAVVFVAAGLFSISPPAAAQEGGKATPGTVTRPEPYVRVTTEHSNLVELQIAVRQFRPEHASGPSVWLAGVSHIGDTNYFSALQRFLNRRTLVLYEGIGGPIGSKDGDAPAVSNEEPEEDNPRPAKGDYSSLQTFMASSLGLVFQLDSIDYSRPNFRNSDLSVEDLRRLLASAPGSSEGGGAAQGFETLLQAMQGGTFINSVLKLGLGFLGASHKLQALGRLALIEVLGEIKGDPSQLRGLPPQVDQLLSVLLVKRNQKVLGDLKHELRCLEPGDSVAIFFGTGHMPDMETRLRKELHYEPGRERWYTAFSVDLAKCGVSPAEREMIHSVIKSQVQSQVSQ